MKHAILLTSGGVVLVVGLVFTIILVTGYNSIVKADESTSNNYAQVQNCLKARHDKIGELLDTLKGQISEEQAIYSAITVVRGSYLGNDASSDADEAAAFNALLAIVEDNEPTFLSQSGFVRLMDEISEAENKLEVSRKDYNDSVRSYNASIRLFPTNMVAGMFGFTSSKLYWAVSQSDTEMPVISFSSASIVASTAFS